MDNNKEYVHSYGSRESQRLSDQANTLADYLHYDSIFPEKSTILEAGCGTGAQTIHLAKNNPHSKIISIDISPSSVKEAKAKVTKLGYYNVSFEVGDIFNLSYEDNSFDHIFMCFVLEHLSEPIKALEQLSCKLKEGGTITVIEGDHDSTLFHPHSEAAWNTIKCLIQLQAEAGGNSLIGRQLFPLLTAAHFKNVNVSPRFIYADASKPHMVEGFTKNTYIAMIEGVKEKAIKNKLISEKRWDKGIQDLYKSAEKDGVFCYTFFKAVGKKILGESK
jgi:ubiquinone/menaquinone biosynthesis C-methylase UbiE